MCHVVSSSSPRHAVPSLEPLELVTGTVFGGRRSPPPIEVTPPPAGGVREVLELLIADALVQPPCLVAFSGGRDSSAILAVAAHVAAKQGLEPPIPVTLRYERHPRTQEAEWQELVVRHLRLEDWTILPIDWELDATGEIAGRALRRFGVYWPPNAHAMVPMLEAAQGGSLLTGNGGDEVLSAWGGRRDASIRAGRGLPAWGEYRKAAVALLPYPVRVAVWERRHRVELPWLQPKAAREFRRASAKRTATHFARWSDALDAFLESRYLELALGIYEAFARDAGTALHQPFLNHHFVRAAARSTSRFGPTSRTSSMTTYFGDLLPKEALRRSTKATFTEVLFGPHSQAFAAEWEGEGLDHALVDPHELRRAWLHPERPDFRSFTPLQAAWLTQAAQE